MPTIRSWRDAVGALQRDLLGVVQQRLRSLVVYEAHGALGDTQAPEADAGDAEIRHEDLIHTLVVVENLEYADLAKLAPLTAGWTRQRLAVPLLLPPSELRRSLDAFPLEFSQILARHVLVFGEDLLGGLKVAHEDLRRACETQVKSHLLHLREGFLQSAGSPERLGQMVAASVVPLRALLVNIARLHGVNARTPDALARFAEERLRLRMEGLRPLLARKPAEYFHAVDVGAFYPAYLAAVEQLARLVDEWTL